MTLDDIIIEALKKLGRPAHLDEIRAEAIQIAAARGDMRKRFNLRTKLAQNPIFENVEPGRGIWQLAAGAVSGLRRVSTDFAVGEHYTRAQIAQAIGLPPKRRKGGTWATGYDRWNGQFFIFCNVGIAGRSGPNHANRWVGKFLQWFGKSTSRLGQPIIDQMIAGVVPVHVFWRGDDKAAFTYAGRATAWEVSDQSPVAVVWGFDAAEHDATVSSHALDEKAQLTNFRRGPPPSPGERKLTIPEGETVLYLMQLHGEWQSLRPELPSDHAIMIRPRREVQVEC